MKTYGIEDAKALIRNYCENWVEIQADGIRLRGDMLQYDPSQQLHWKYVCELDGPNAPNPLTAPCLPFPFTANELAAFLLDGVGAVVTSYYGNWADGPDEGMLDSLGVLAREPRNALRQAYAAYSNAEKAVGKLDEVLQQQAHELQRSFNQANLDANALERVFESGASEAERSARRETARASVAALKVQADATTTRATNELVVWRRAMVNQLLLPVVVSHTGPLVAAGTSVPLPRQRAQEKRILELIEAAGHDALKLPKSERGKKGIKSTVKVLALKEPALFTPNSFDKAWQRLREDGRLAGD